MRYSIVSVERQVHATDNARMRWSAMHTRAKKSSSELRLCDFSFNMTSYFQQFNHFRSHEQGSIIPDSSQASDRSL